MTILMVHYMDILPVTMRIGKLENALLKDLATRFLKTWIVLHLICIPKRMIYELW